MYPPPSQDISLYELALSSGTSLSPLQVSPATLKSMISTVIDLLISQQIPASLWAKLPRGEVWQAEITRYCAAVRQPHAVYLFNNHREDLGEELGVLESPSTALAAEHSSDDHLLLSDADFAHPWLLGQSDLQDAELSSDLFQSSITSIALPAESQLRREYFLLAIADDFCGLVLAHRPRSIRPHRTENTSAGTARNNRSTPDEEPSERKQHLLALCTFDGSTAQQVLQGLQTTLAYSQAQEAVNHGDAAITSSPTVPWDALSTICQHYQADPRIVGQLMTEQIRRQEEIWHRMIYYRKQAEVVESLKEQTEELQNAMRRKDEFLSNVGQELRTPLTNMKTALSLLNSPQLKPAQRQRYMQLLSTECDRQSSLITSLMNLVQLEYAADNTAIQPINLSDVVPGVVSTYQPLAQEKGIMLAYTIPEDLPPVACLSSWLKQIVINLLHNGIKFTPSGGQVWVRAKQQGDYAQLEFRDTGIGIATHELPKIFDRFYRVRHSEDYGGAGLGLTIVQQILLRCGGSISVKSKPGEGSVFNVLLPIYRQ